MNFTNYKLKLDFDISILHFIFTTIFIHYILTKYVKNQILSEIIL